MCKSVIQELTKQTIQLFVDAVLFMSIIWSEIIMSVNHAVPQLRSLFPVIVLAFMISPEVDGYKLPVTPGHKMVATLAAILIVDNLIQHFTLKPRHKIMPKRSRPLSAPLVSNISKIPSAAVVDQKQPLPVPLRLDQTDVSTGLLYTGFRGPCMNHGGTNYYGSALKQNNTMIKHGYGEEICVIEDGRSFKYKGMFMNGMKHGVGMLMLLNGNTIVWAGEWYYNKRCKGIQYNQGGSVTVQQWEPDSVTGQNKCTRAFKAIASNAPAPNIGLGHNIGFGHNHGQPYQSHQPQSHQPQSHQPQQSRSIITTKEGQLPEDNSA
jgi:hypothetical protein